MTEKGQALLVVVLVMTIALTVGLSVATRAAVNIRLASQEEQSQRAFSAAEAGIEETLRTCTASACPTPAPLLAPEGLGNYTTFTVDPPKAVAGNQIIVSGGNLIAQDEGTQIWLSNYPDYTNPFSGNITVYWGTVGVDACNQAAMEIIIISGTVNSPSLFRSAYDSCIDRSPPNNFSAAQVGPPFNVSGKSFPYSSSQISISNGLLMRIVPLYKSSPLAVSASANLPAQGFEITSTGKTMGVTSPIQRKIKVFNSYPQLPASLFNYTLFSGGSAALSQ